VIERDARTAERLRLGSLRQFGLPFRRGGTVLFLAAVALLPLFESDIFRLRILTIAWLAGVLVVGVTISLGYAGLFNMSQGTFYGIGAYTAGLLILKTDVPFEVALLAAIFLTAASGVIIGLTALRVRGDLWALVSMAFTVALVTVFQNWNAVTMGRDGFGIAPVSLFGITLNTPIRFYYAAYGALVFALVVNARVRRTFLGRAMIAVRHDEAAAAMMGITPGRYKLLAMGLSAGLAGLAGAFLIATSLFITPASFSFFRSFDITLFGIVGGITSAVGGVVAAALLIVVTEAFRNLTEYRLMILGGALILAIFVRSGVIGSAATRAYYSLRRARASL
jgi:branched-chain amino acid transport system permease protein